MNEKEKWSSLDKAKFILSIFTTVFTALLTIGILYYGNKIENSKWKNQTLISKKIELYDNMMPKLNDILCYFNQYGTYKDYTPLEIIKLKRELNKTFYTNKSFLPKSLQKEYIKFIDTLCFEPYGGSWDSRLRMNAVYNRRGYIEQHGDSLWNEQWNKKLFTGEKSDRITISKSYDKIMTLFVDDIDLKN